MKEYNLSVLDIYQVINKSLFNSTDKLVLTTLYMPIIGNDAVILYLTLQNEISISGIIGGELSHKYLVATTGLNPKKIKEARTKLEGIGLMKTFVKEGDISSYVYELYSPVTATEFFNHPVFNMVLFNNIGKDQYNRLLEFFKFPKINYKEYNEITYPFDMAYKSEAFNTLELTENIIAKETLMLKYELDFDFDVVISSIPKSIFNSKCLTKSMKELIINLGFLYNLDPIVMSDLIKSALNEKGTIVKEELRKNCRKYYQLNNNNRLPSLMFKSQPSYLKRSLNDNSNKNRIIQVFENNSPYEFLKAKYKGVRPTNRDMNILEELLVDLKLSPGVVNVLIDYVLKTNNNKLVKGYIDTIAGQWKRSGIETALEAMDYAEAEHNKRSKKETNYNKKRVETVPVWFDKNIDDTDISIKEKQELEDMLKEFK